MGKHAKPQLVRDAVVSPETPEPEWAPTAIDVEITVFEKRGGHLTKRISLDNDKIVSDGSGCRMAKGTAHCERFTSHQAIADRINGFNMCEALALGCPKDGTSDIVRVVTKRELNGAPGVIARSKDFLGFREGKQSLCLFDIDTKGMPDEVKHRVKESGGVWGALTRVLPELDGIGRVERASTSSCLRNSETGEEFEGSGGQHIYIVERDGADTKRFLATLHDRLWLAGYGFGVVSKAGSFLERSLIDRLVAAPERLCFEAPPNVDPPLQQDREKRKAIAFEGGVFDTQLCKPPNRAEKAELKKLRDAERDRLKPEMVRAREAWIADHIKQLTDTGMSADEARARVERMLDERELAGAFELVFADRALGGATVAAVLADPDRYVGQNLADPFEGVEYGRTTAILFRYRDGSLWVHSFAHGGIKYRLVTEEAAILPPGYTRDAKGIWYTDSATTPRTAVCGPVNVIAMTRDGTANNHGLLLRWADLDGVEHTWAMPRELVHADGNQIARELERAGLSCGTSNKAHELLKQLLGGVRVGRRMRCVARTGWHGSTLVLPGGGVIGPGRDDIVLQSEHVVVGEKYAARHTLLEWQDNVSRFAVGNDLMVLHISASFAAPLLDVFLETFEQEHAV
jgi:hypothetical protein